MSAVKRVKISEIVVREDFNTRGEMTDVTSLAESIRTVGLQQPIVINQDRELVAGFRRFAACQYLKMKTIDAKILLPTGNATEEQMQRLIHIDENIEREDLPPHAKDKALAERKKIYDGLVAKGIKKRSDFYKEMSEKTGESETTIRKSIARVENTSKAVQAAYEEGNLIQGQVSELVKLSKDKQDQLLSGCLGGSIADTQRQVADELKRGQLNANNSVSHPSLGVVDISKFVSHFRGDMEKMVTDLMIFTMNNLPSKMDGYAQKSVKEDLSILKDSLKKVCDSLMVQW